MSDQPAQPDKDPAILPDLDEDSAPVVADDPDQPETPADPDTPPDPEDQDDADDFEGNQPAAIPRSPNE